MFVLPDIIKDNFSGSAEITGAQPEGHYWFFPSEVKQAILDQNVKKVRDAKQKHADDLKANLDLIKEKQKDAFKTKINPSTKQEYQLCETDTGIMWTYPVDVQHAADKYKVTVAVGSFSKNANILGISTTIIGWIPANIAAAVVSGVAADAVATFIAQRLAGVAFPAALAFVEALVTSALEAVGIVVSGLVVTIASFVTGLIAFVVVGLLVFYIISLIKKTFGLEVNIYNWSTTEEWDVVEWYGDNADMQDTGKPDPFRQSQLPPITGTILMPDGTTIPSTDLATSYATYTVINHNTWLEGVGIGLKVVSKTEPSRVIYLKYVIHWKADNELNLGSASSTQSLSDFYKGDWAKAGTMSMQIDIPASGAFPAIPVIALTPSLTGESSHLYTFDIHINASK